MKRGTVAHIIKDIVRSETWARGRGTDQFLTNRFPHEIGLNPGASPVVGMLVWIAAVHGFTVGIADPKI
jgi:hypothetical protein